MHIRVDFIVVFVHGSQHLHTAVALARKYINNNMCCALLLMALKLKRGASMV